MRLNQFPRVTTCRHMLSSQCEYCFWSGTEVMPRYILYISIKSALCRRCSRVHSFNLFGTAYNPGRRFRGNGVQLPSPLKSGPEHKKQKDWDRGSDTSTPFLRGGPSCTPFLRNRRPGLYAQSHFRCYHRMTDWMSCILLTTLVIGWFAITIDYGV